MSEGILHTMANDRIRELEKQLHIMTKCAQESQDWNWISANERAEGQGHDFYEIYEMKWLHEIAFGKTEENK